MVSLRAALNLAHEKEQVASDATWKLALKPIRGANRRRELYLDHHQRKRLLDHAPEDVAPFLRACALLPLRPGAVAALTAGDYDGRQEVVTISKDKGNKTRKIKLPAGVAALFRDQARCKLPSAPLFAQLNGRPWSRNEWAVRMRQAVVAAKLPPAATAYSLRHSTITDLVTDNKLDLLTIAQIAGTSVKMIEEHYGHLRKENAVQALAVLSL
jgi:integrase